jgi:hypothetical protein
MDPTGATVCTEAEMPVRPAPSPPRAILAALWLASAAGVGVGCGADGPPPLPVQTVSLADRWAVALDPPKGAQRLTLLLEGEHPASIDGIEAATEAGGWTQLVPVRRSGRWAVFVWPGPLSTSVRLRGRDGRRLEAAWGFEPVERPSPDHGVATRSRGLAPELRALGLASREDWQAASPTCATTSHRPFRATIHHTASSVRDRDDAADLVRMLQAFHQEGRGWCDIGYHFLVGPDGHVFEGRPLSVLGAHVKGMNQGNLGIALLGCFDSSGCDDPAEPRPAALSATRELIATLNALGALSPSRVAAHRNLAATLCPGDRVVARWDALMPEPAEPPLPVDEPGMAEPGQTAVSLAPSAGCACTETWLRPLVWPFLLGLVGVGWRRRQTLVVLRASSAASSSRRVVKIPCSTK